MKKKKKESNFVYTIYNGFVGLMAIACFMVIFYFIGKYYLIGLLSVGVLGGLYLVGKATIKIRKVEEN